MLDVAVKLNEFFLGIEFVARGIAPIVAFSEICFEPKENAGAVKFDSDWIGATGAVGSEANGATGVDKKVDEGVNNVVPI